MTPLISVIIPVYNTEKYLRRCINGVLSQTFTDFECILIDDGSTDDSPAMCDAYKDNDDRIRVIHKKNEGISAARQLGIEEAKGKYSIHVDSDDTIDKDMFSGIYNKIVSDGADILLMDYYENYPSGKQIYRHQTKDNDGVATEKLLNDILRQNVQSCLWLFLIKHDLYAENNIKFAKNINYGEDTLVITELLLKKPRITTLSRAYYHHYLNKDSFTGKKNKNKYYNRILFLDSLDNLLKKNSRQDLTTNTRNIFKINTKYEMLSEGFFKKKEYQSIIPLAIDKACIGLIGIKKYFLLKTAETNAYLFSKTIAVFIRYVKTLISHA
jgi:glycosyltransferase involved in cell wall biosynthesis